MATATSAEEIERAPRQLLERLDVLEVRADLCGDLGLDWLRQRFGGELLYTLRSKRESGRFRGDPGDRARRIREASPGYDLVDLELARDLGDDTLRAIAPPRRLLSWHGGPTDVGGLRRKLDAMDQVEARYRKLVPACRRSGQELAPIALLAATRRTDLATFATGEIGAWTRLVAARAGSPLLYASLSSRPAAPGQPVAARLLADYELDRIRGAERLYGICGNPVDHSLSPRIHNRGYAAHDLAALFVPFHVERFADFWLEVVESAVPARTGAPLAGLSVTAPWKDAALAVAGASSPRAQRLDSANTLVLHDGVWEAESTDPDGVTGPLEHAGVELRGSAAAVLGCGGAGRAAALALANAGAEVTVFNRSEERGRHAAEMLELPFAPLPELDPARFGILVNATALGHGPADALPFDPEQTGPEAIVVDLVYDEAPTPLELASRAADRHYVSGREVLVAQARSQFRILTGAELPPDGGALLADEPPHPVAADVEPGAER